MLASTLFAVNIESILPYSPIAIGCLVGLVVITVLALRRRGLRNPIPPIELSRPGDWENDEQSFANRRNSLRREGSPVKITIAASTLKAGTENGYVLDRSTGGLRIATGAALAPGTAVQVRAINAPTTVPWVTVIVRSCRNTGPHFEVGCEFDQTPPWNVLLLFG